jgi:hypothetical protein
MQIWKFFDKVTVAVMVLPSVDRYQSGQNGTQGAVQAAT